MGVPTNLTANTLRQAQSGIVVGMTPSTGSPRFRTELQISTQSSTASSAWSSVFLDPTTAQYQYTFGAPLSTRTFYFRARHLLTGYSNGPFTGTVNAKPALLPELMQPLMPMLNSKSNVEVLGGDIWLSSAKTAKVGTQQSTGKITKRLVFSYPLFAAESTLAPVSYNGAMGLTTTGATTYFFRAQIPLPVGVRLTLLSISGNRKSTAATVSVVVSRSSRFATFDSTKFTVSLGASTALQPVSADSSALNFTIGTSDTWHARVRLRRTVGDVSFARLFALRWTYEMPSYDKSI